MFRPTDMDPRTKGVIKPDLYRVRSGNWIFLLRSDDSARYKMGVKGNRKRGKHPAILTERKGTIMRCKFLEEIRTLRTVVDLLQRLSKQNI